MKQIKLLILTILVFQFIQCSGADEAAETNLGNDDTNLKADSSSDTASGKDSNLKGKLFINEVNANGDPDWYELYNASDLEIDLSGFYVIDNSTDISWYKIPEGTKLVSKGFLKEDCTDEVQGFKLSGSKGDSLSLYDKERNLIDTISWTSDKTPETSSYGRVSDGGDFKVLKNPTPGAANNEEEFSTEQSDTSSENGSDNNGDDSIEDPSSGESGDAVKVDPNAVSALKGSLVVNEVNPDGDPEDWFEVMNLTDAEIDLSGFLITDEKNETPEAVAAGTKLSANSFLKIESVTNGLGKKGDSLNFYDRDGKLIDSVTWTSKAVSHSRIPDGTGDFKESQTATPGEANKE